MADIANIIKAIQNIMRKDAGVDGDALRLSQLAWMLFLKVFDDHEKQRELDPAYRSSIPEELRWRNWAAKSEGMTGKDLLEFIDQKLFPTLRALPVANPDSSAAIVQSVFADSYNYMKNGTLIRQVINKLQEINFNKQADRHQFGDVYEKLLKDLQSAGNYGEFYTPRPLTRFIVEVLAPTVHESVLDPACGTGGFLVNVLEFVREQEGMGMTAAKEKELEQNVHGIELKGLPHLLATTNFLLHDVANPFNLKHDDALARAYADWVAQRVDVVVANPPFGASVADGIEKNFPSDLRTKATEFLFLVLFTQVLKLGGRAGVVLPDGVLFAEGVASKIKEKLLTECNVHTIVRLPPGVFSPYAGVNTNLVFFEKGEPTKEVWYYQLPLPEGIRAYTKGRPITHEEFGPVKKWWGGLKRKGRKESPDSWKVSINQIRERGWNLDFKNPNSSVLVEHKMPKDLLRDIEAKEIKISALLRELKKEV